MHIQSMTGFGRGVAENFNVEVRSTNHKNLDIQTNVPSYLYSYEAEIRKLVKERFSRGRIEIYITRQEGVNKKLKLNKPLAREYYNALVSLRDELSISEKIGINVLTSMRDIFSLEESEVNTAEFYNVLNTALEELEKMRIEEGKSLVKDIKERTGILNRYLTLIENKRAEFIANARERLYEKLKDILDNTSIDDSRLIQEVSILIERSDITEEIVRIKSHLKNVEALLKSDEAIGKKIDFFTQELRREINTIGSKASDAEISTYVVEMKHELEKIREQAQNLQ